VRRTAIWETTKNCLILILFLLSIPVLTFLVLTILQTHFAHVTRENGTTIDPNIAAVSLFGIN